MPAVVNVARASRWMLAALGLALAGCTAPPAEYAYITKFPTPNVTWREAGQIVRPMPFLRQNGYQIFTVVDLESKGLSERFLIDTGSHFTMFTRQYCEAHHHRTVGYKAVIEGVDRTIDVDLVILDAWDLGFARINHLAVEIAPRGFLDSLNDGLRKAGLKEISGIIGSEVLNALGAVLDLSTQTITFTPPTARAPVAAGERR